MLPGLVITAVAVVALVYFVDLGEMQKALALADYRVLPFVVLMFFGTIISRAMAWRTVLMEQARFRDCFLTLNQGYLLNNLLPFRLGELGRALLIGGRVGMRFWRALSSIVVERVFDLGIAAGLLFATFPLVVGADWARSAAIITLVVVVIGFAMLFVMARRPALFTRLVERITSPSPKLTHWLKDKLASFLEGLSALNSAGRFLRVAFWMLLTWFFNVAWYYLLMRSFLPEATWLWALFTIAVASVGVAIPSSPAYVGVFESVLVGAMTLFGVDPAISLAYAVVAHILYFVVTGIIGIIGFWQQGESLGEVYRKLLARPG
ncbi:MAG: flippase-like domain-containing protein [Chloroflexi bacterium]|nr:flippase-like domain-containing protein [Chloroflexota bacterium]